MADVSDGSSGAALADEGIALVLENESERWIDVTAANVIRFLRSHAEYCADDLYRYGLMPFAPHHPNAIGALTRRLIEHGYLSPVGSMRSEREPAHVRRIIVYQSTVFTNDDGLPF